MNHSEIPGLILEAIPYPIVYVDAMDHIIRYMNRAAKYHYHQERGYPDLIGRSIFECHNEESRRKILEAVKKLGNHGQEMFMRVNVRNHRVYLTPVRDGSGNLVGYFQRYEMNMQT
ncbi:MAG: PAS domain-containing protein [Syntrophales bacterium]|nr:PAS domain-containing protein [Syntrophales bacterium]